MMILALLLCLQDTVEMKAYQSSYEVVKPADYGDRMSWPAIVDLGNPKDPAREPGAFVLVPGSRKDEAFVLACLLDLKSRYRINPERVLVRGGWAALTLATDHPELFAACALRRPRGFTPPKKAPPCAVFVAPGDPDRVQVLAAAMVMRRAGNDVDLREAGDRPGEILEALGPRIHPKGTLTTADDFQRQGRWLDATLVLIDLLDNPEVARLARTKLKSIEGTAIIELAKVEIAMSERKYKDAVLRCRAAAFQFAWVPPGEKIRKRLGELESRADVRKALEADD
ncbi:MAG TPA: hypothetical protein VKW04_10970 [Planctomycetota bacterium]|nr:hypothetical protein [Planctomycetota bacterium]